jgi:hypothetical protein
MGSEGDEQPPSASDSDASDVNSSLTRGEFVLLGGIVVVLLAAVALGMSGAGGPTAVGADGGSTPTPEGTVTAAESEEEMGTETGTGAETGTAAERAPAIAMQVRSIESCGSRCRSVTVALSNTGDAPAYDVHVTTRITTDGALVWEGQSDVGRLDAGETVTRTRTIEVGYLDAARIEANDGVIRIETTVRTASGTRVFTERRDVL